MGKRRLTTIPEVAKETLALEVYLRDLKPGAAVSFAEIHRQTGVPMDTKGKSHLRTAAKRAGKIWGSIRGLGVQLADETHGPAIIASECMRVDNAVRKAEKKTTIVYEAFGAKMTKADRDLTVGLLALFGTVRVLADQRKREIRRLERSRPKLARPSPLTL